MSLHWYHISYYSKVCILCNNSDMRQADVSNLTNSMISYDDKNEKYYSQCN